MASEHDSVAVRAYEVQPGNTLIDGRHVVKTTFSAQTGVTLHFGTRSETFAQDEIIHLRA